MCLAVFPNCKLSKEYTITSVHLVLYIKEDNFEIGVLAQGKKAGVQRYARSVFAKTTVVLS